MRNLANRFAHAFGIIGLLSAVPQVRAEDTHGGEYPFSGEVTAVAQIPHGMYVQSDNPDCGVTHEGIHSLIENPAAVQAISNALPPGAAAAVILVSVADQITNDCGGGWLCEQLRHGKGANDHASCASLCASTPSHATLVIVNISNRHGELNTWLTPAEVQSGYGNQSTGDWSGWRDVVSARDAQGRVIVCGIGTNWSDGETATKRLVVRYRL